MIRLSRFLAGFPVPPAVLPPVLPVPVFPVFPEKNGTGLIYANFVIQK
jgi:hypothetical protein